MKLTVSFKYGLFHKTPPKSSLINFMYVTNDLREKICAWKMQRFVSIKLQCESMNGR